MGDILMTYKDEIIKSMKILSEDDRVIFIGQLIKYWGCTYGTLVDIPEEKKIEVPIFEETQMGISIGFALEGYIPITVYPRMDFLIIAMNQIVNHLDKIEEMSDGEFKPKVIIRTIIGSKHPLNPGPQHCQDYTELFKVCLKNIHVVKLETEDNIVEEYIKALYSEKSTLFIEDRELYD